MMESCLTIKTITQSHHQTTYINLYNEKQHARFAHDKYVKKMGICHYALEICDNISTVLI